MKRIKIMLMGVVVLAAVGGALAFNAKKFSVNYCIDSIRTPVNLLSTTGANNCNFLVETSTTVQLPSIDIKYITPAVDGKCTFTAGDPACPAFYRTEE